MDQHMSTFSKLNTTFQLLYFRLHIRIYFCVRFPTDHNLLCIFISLIWFVDTFSLAVFCFVYILFSYPLNFQFILFRPRQTQNQQRPNQTKKTKPKKPKQNETINKNKYNWANTRANYLCKDTTLSMNEMELEIYRIDAVNTVNRGTSSAAQRALGKNPCKTNEKITTVCYSASY